MGSSSSKRSFRVVSNFTDPAILDRYDGFLVDQWGVMHNGVEHLEGAPACIAELAARGKKLVILSNSPSSEQETLGALLPLGFVPAHFGGAITSGMMASAYIRKNYGETTNGKKESTGGDASGSALSTTQPKRKALIMAWAHPAAPPYKDFLKRCGDIEVVGSVADKPDVLIVQGNEILLCPNDRTGNDKYSHESLGDFVVTGNTEKVIDPILKACVEEDIPLVCVDPDFITVNQDGSTFYMPGTVAKRYEELGGRADSCVYFGKPHAPGFEEGVSRLIEMGVPGKDRIAMIGDSLHHDVAGASTVGLDSIMVLGGVHRKELGNEFGQMVDCDKLEALFVKHGCTPTIVAPLLKI